ncbi:MAG TPA: Ni/Fe hydrogenase subunit alpha [Actinomycetota bacterium]|nr:Ni/Fe hydrogenase subunit alpha [Actinomycetota bacterium]
MTEILIDPITRLEGHGRIHIFLNDDGAVDRAYLQIPELRGFEAFAQGRRAEDMPQITSRICGVCPMAHHMAGTKTLDDLYHVQPPPAAVKVREMVYDAFMIEDHALHFFYLGGPDFVVGPTAPKAERNILGVIGTVGLEIGKQVIAARKEIRGLMTEAAGKAIHPVFGLPGGISKPISGDLRDRFVTGAAHAVELGKLALQLFRDVVLSNAAYVDLVTSDAYTHRTYYMGLVDGQNRVNFYDGHLRVVDPEGKEFLSFDAKDYLEHVAEHVEPWSYIKFSYLKDVGWKGFADGPGSGVFAVAPLARLNAAEGMSTPMAQEAYEELFSTLGGRPVHHTLATHWARIVELINAAERMGELAADPEITDPEVRTIPTETPDEGIGVVEAPRGTLIHHYRTDERGLITQANLIVATQSNAARIALSVDKAAKALIHGPEVDEGLLNEVEMAFRAYDPCFGCATHALPGEMPLILEIRDRRGRLVREIRRD